MKFSPQQIRTRADLSAAITVARQDGKRIGFVPTMGALHDGHLSLIALAQAKADFVVASIFVNPTQFAPGEDLEDYPRTEAADLKKLAAYGCDVAYLPGVDEMYPAGSVTHVRVEALSDLLDGKHRPHFFYGVTTIVARLFIHVQPDIAVFGEKDFQQLQIIRQMVRDLGFPIEIIGGATMRDADGLAQSSRNAYLTDEQREEASTLSAVLHRAGCRLEAGANLAAVLAEARASIQRSGFSTLDYISAVDPHTLQDLSAEQLMTGFEGRLLAAAWLGQTRLIDNLGFVRGPSR
ncbi:MAG: pantoate--beta-alanine ligase [Pseudomonadota bacterium]